MKVYSHQIKYSHFLTGFLYQRKPVFVHKFVHNLLGKIIKKILEATMKNQLKVKFFEMATAGNTARNLRLFVLFAVLISSIIFPEIAAADGPKPGPTGE
jgi:hypothetical protein